MSREVPDHTIAPLRDGPMEGHFPADLEDALRRDPSIVITAARTLVDQQFPLTLAPDVLSAVGLDPDEVYGVSAWHVPVARRKRNAGWRDRILNAWDGACAFCGFDGRIGGSPKTDYVQWHRSQVFKGEPLIA